jgi:hypothetical protein
MIPLKPTNSSKLIRLWPLTFIRSTTRSSAKRSRIHYVTKLYSDIGLKSITEIQHLLLSPLVCHVSMRAAHGNDLFVALNDCSHFSGEISLLLE